jgi:hypothetical protein
VHETPQEIEHLQRLLDASAAQAGPHLRSIITEERRLSAEELCGTLESLCLLVVATTTADGRPIASPVDGYFLHGSFYFSSGRDSVRMRHLRARPWISASYVPGEQLAVNAHGRAELFPMSDSQGADLRQAMLDHYLPKQGPEFERWLEREDPMAARIEAEKMFTFHL